MTKKEMRIVFMGTPDFAVESLKALLENDYTVVGVITMPDKPSGRGHKIHYSAVKQYAREKNLPLLQPEKLKDETFLNDLRAWNADLQIVVAFRMLPQLVWDMPPLGTFNLHASLLPQYRGAAPINWAIMNGEKETGVTTFFLTHEIDTGKVIRQVKVAIGEEDNAGTIHDRLMTTGAKFVCETVNLIIDNQVDAIAQGQLYIQESELVAAPKIFKETCRIDWTQSTDKIHNHIRGLAPYPTAWTELYCEGKAVQLIKIYAASILPSDNNLPIGKINTDNKTYLHVGCTGGCISIKEIQFAGKKAMKIEEVLRGFKFEEGSYFK